MLSFCLHMVAGDYIYFEKIMCDGRWCCLWISLQNRKGMSERTGKHWSDLALHLPIYTQAPQEIKSIRTRRKTGTGLGIWKVNVESLSRERQGEENVCSDRDCSLLLCSRSSWGDRTWAVDAVENACEGPPPGSLQGVAKPSRWSHKDDRSGMISTHPPPHDNKWAFGSIWKQFNFIWKEIRKCKIS